MRPLSNKNLVKIPVRVQDPAERCDVTTQSKLFPRIFIRIFASSNEFEKVVKQEQAY